MSAATSDGVDPEVANDEQHENKAQIGTPQPQVPDVGEPHKVFGYPMTKQQFLKIMLDIYTVFFGIHRAAELAYIGTVDAKFPQGLEHLYHSETQRMAAVSYIRQSLLCSLLRETANFALVMLLVRSEILPKFDETLGELLQAINRTLEPCLRWCGCCSKVFCCPCRVARASIISWHDLFRGTLFLQALAVLFFVTNVPFRIWLYKINVHFGFINTLTVPSSLFLWMQVMHLKKLITSGWIMVMLKLPFLKARYGWLFLWICMVCVVALLQNNPQAAIRAEFNMIQIFPHFFGVGRNFPLLRSPKARGPWLSANRIYYEKEPVAAESNASFFETRDNSVGPLTLQDDEEHRRMTLFDRNSSILAQAQGASSRIQPWMVNGNTLRGARVGFRKGKRLRDELFGLARDRDVGIDEVYMIDASSKDTRANAFVAGAGENRIVGLYDTLFLGDGPTRETPEDAVSLFTFAGGEVDLDNIKEAITGVDSEDAGNDRQPLWHRDTTLPMSDGEVLAILGHELGHSAMHHVEWKVTGLSVNSFISFAVWGWMALSLLVSSAFAFLEPSIHCGVFAFDHIVGPPLDGLFNLIGNTIARRHEYQADAYSAEISEAYATNLQSSLANLAVSSNEDPDTPFFWELLHNSHPSVAKRWAAVEELKRRFYGANPSVLIQPARIQPVALRRRHRSAPTSNRLRKQ